MIKKRALAVLAAIATAAATAALIAIGVALMGSASILAVIVGAILMEASSAVGAVAIVYKVIDAINVFLCRRCNATLKNGGVKMVKDAEKHFSTLKADMNLFMKNELPHATETELQALEHTFLRALKAEQNNQSSFQGKLIHKGLSFKVEAFFIQGIKT